MQPQMIQSQMRLRLQLALMPQQRKLTLLLAMWKLAQLMQ